MTALLGLTPSLIACDSADTKASDGAMGGAGGAMTASASGGASTGTATGGAGGATTGTATGGTGGASTGTATGGAGGAGGAGTGTATGGGTSSTNKEEECAIYDDEPSGGNVVVRFRNDSGQPIYLPTGCKSLQYELTYLDGEAPNVTFEGEITCAAICSDQMKYSGSVRNCFDCTPTTFLLGPGATREATWDGVGRFNNGWSMPWYCYGYGYPGTPCDRVVTAPEGLYRIDALGYAECDGCTCDDEGACTGKTMGAQATATPVTISFPTETLVEVVFDACAFGCPDP